MRIIIERRQTFNIKIVNAAPWFGSASEDWWRFGFADFVKFIQRFYVLKLGLLLYVIGRSWISPPPTSNDIDKLILWIQNELITLVFGAFFQETTKPWEEFRLLVYLDLDCFSFGFLNVV